MWYILLCDSKMVTLYSMATLLCDSKIVKEFDLSVGKKEKSSKGHNRVKQRTMHGKRIYSGSLPCTAMRLRQGREQTGWVQRRPC